MTTAALTMSGTSPGAPGSAATTAIVVPGAAGYFDAIIYQASLVGATGGTLDVYVQTTFDGGSTWWDIGHFTQLAAGGAAIKHLWSTTLDVGANAVVSGDGAMAANTFVSGPIGSQLRLKFTAGAGTTLGAAQSVIANFIRKDPA